VEPLWLDFDGGELLVGFDPCGGVRALVELGIETFSPVRAIKLMMTSLAFERFAAPVQAHEREQPASDFPLLVAGGKWQTTI
jgi:hypothetical protein